MVRKNIIAGLEIGRTKVAMIAGEFKNGDFNFLGASKIRCLDGVKNGAVVNLDSVIEAIIKLVDDVSQKSGKKINFAFINIGGLNITEEITHTVMALPQRSCEISQKHIEDLIDSCKIMSVPLDRHLLYLSPLEYIIDEQEGIKNPIGLCGNKLEAKVFIVTAPFNQVQNIIKAANFAGLEVGEVVLNPIANSYSLIGDKEKRDGALLIDFKTDFTELSIFKGDALLFFKTVTKGQGDITNEIAARFNLPLEIAEDLKVRYGFLPTSSAQDSRSSDTIPLEWMGKSLKISRGDLNKIISEQLEIIFNFILEEIKDFSGFNDIVRTGAIITGGCTSMEGFLEWASRRLGFFVRQGLVKTDLGFSGEGYVTAAGLLKLGVKKNQELQAKGRVRLFKKAIQKTEEILSDYF